MEFGDIVCHLQEINYQWRKSAFSAKRSEIEKRDGQ